MHASQLADRRDFGKVLGEPVALDEGAIRGESGCVEGAREPVEADCGLLRAPACRRRGREEHGGGHLLEVTLGEGPVAVPGEDDLALLGHLETPRHRAGRLCHHRPVGRTASAPEGTAPAMEESQSHRLFCCPRGEVRLSLVQREACGDGAALLG